MYTFDHDLFLWLNFDGGPVIDSAMKVVSGIWMWIPLYLLIIYLVWRKLGWCGHKAAIVSGAVRIVCCAVCIVLCRSCSFFHILKNFKVLTSTPTLAQTIPQKKAIATELVAIAWLLAVGH